MESTRLSAKPSVLVVDDNATNRMAFQAVLEKDFDVTTAESGAQAIDLCRKGDFTVIVLDVRMPGMNGFDTAEALRKTEATQAIPIIIFTSAYDQNMDQINRGFVAGATDFLFSPVEPALLKLKVTTYARIHLRHQSLRLKVQQLNDALARLHAELERRGWSVPGLKEVEQTASELVRHTL